MFCLDHVYFYHNYSKSMAQIYPVILPFYNKLLVRTRKFLVETEASHRDFVNLIRLNTRILKSKITSFHDKV